MRNAYKSATLLACLTVGLFVAAGPALADTELGHTGTVGVHALYDTTSSPGVGCEYKYLNAYNKEKLIKLWVGWPEMKAVSGQTNQKVGWVVIVQRRAGANSANPAWINQFISTEQTAYTNSTQNAQFAERPITVSVPYGPADQSHFANYRVNIRMIWHKANGSVMGTALHRVNQYGAFDKDQVGGFYPRSGKCRAYEATF